MHKTDFTKSIYEKLKKVPKGKVVTYASLAKSLNSKAYRAVGRAMKNNTDPENIPCFRVICSDGFVGNYSAPGGINRKIQLLKKEGIKVKNKKIDLKKYGFSFKN